MSDLDDASHFIETMDRGGVQAAIEFGIDYAERTRKADRDKLYRGWEALKRAVEKGQEKRRAE